MQSLKEYVQTFLSSKNKEQFCVCGNRKSHSLIFCQRCGHKFSDGYIPRTQGQKIKYLLDKPGRNQQYPPEYFGAIILRSCKDVTGDENLTIKEITREIERQLKINRVV